MTNAQKTQHANYNETGKKQEQSTTLRDRSQGKPSRDRKQQRENKRQF